MFQVLPVKIQYGPQNTMLHERQSIQETVLSLERKITLIVFEVFSISERFYVLMFSSDCMQFKMVISKYLLHVPYK